MNELTPRPRDAGRTGPVRVAHVGYLRPDSCDGVAQTIFGIVKNLPREEVLPEVWEFSSQAQTVEETQAYGVKLVRLPAYHRSWLHTLALPAVTRRFLGSATEVVDLIHLHSVFRPDNLWSCNLGVAYLHTPNGGYSQQVLEGRNRALKTVWVILWERRLWSRASALHAVSHSEAHRLQVLAPGQTVVMIPNGIDARLVESRPDGPGPDGYWLFLGRHAIEQKGLDLLLHAYALAGRAHTLPILRLVGPDSHGGKLALRELAERLGIAGRVEFAKPVQGEEKYTLLTKARILFQPSRWEGMPFAVLEALALGVPVVVTPQTGLAEAVAEANAGWVSSSDVQSLANTMQNIMRTARADMELKSNHARQLVAEKFTWQSVARDMARLYRAIVLSPP